MITEARAGPASAVIDERPARLAAAISRVRGYLDRRSLARTVRLAAAERPDLELLGQTTALLGREPPPFGSLLWNADTTRMTAGLHRDFLQMGVTNALVQPRRSDDSRVTGGPGRRRLRQLPGRRNHRHICPWQSCYRSTQLLGGRKRFVLSTSGQDWLLLYNGIGASPELLQPFVDALDLRRGVVRFDMPGIGGVPGTGAPLSSGHLATAAERAARRARL